MTKVPPGTSPGQPVEVSLESAALADRAYLSGLQMGWRLGLADDRRMLAHIRDSYERELRLISPKASASTPRAPND